MVPLTDEVCTWTADHVHASRMRVRMRTDVVSSLQALVDELTQTRPWEQNVTSVHSIDFSAYSNKCTPLDHGYIIMSFSCTHAH